MSEKIKNYFSNLSLRKKMLFSYILIISLTIILVATVISYFFRTSELDKQLSQQLTIDELTLNNFANQISEYENHIFTYFVNSQIASLYTSQTEYENEYLKLQNEASVISSELSFLIYRFSNINQTAFLTLDGNIYTASKDSLDEDITDLVYVLNNYPISDNNPAGICYWHFYNNQKYIKRDIYLYLPTVKKIGTVVMSIDSDFGDSLLQQNSSFISYTVILNADKQPVFSHNSLDISAMLDQNMDQITESAGTTNINYNGTDYVVICVKSQNKWYLINSIPANVLYNSSIKIINSIYLVGIMVLFLAILLSYYLSKKMYTNIDDLMVGIQSMKTGNLKYKIKVKSQDEIGLLSTHFNEMSDRISELIDKVVEEERIQKELNYQVLLIKYHALQSQINPHFMYNALDTISSHARLAGDKYVSDLIIRFSRLLRKNIEMHNKMIPLSKEIDYIDDFLYIYKSIYPNRFVYNIYTEDNISHVLIPSLILQPLVENAIKHNINSSSTLSVSVRAYNNDKDLVVEIEDDGKGIDEASQKRLMDLWNEKNIKINKNDSSGGVGLENTIKRLRLIYEPDAISFSIMSSENNGTLIRLIFSSQLPSANLKLD